MADTRTGAPSTLNLEEQEQQPTTHSQEPAFISSPSTGDEKQQAWWRGFVSPVGALFMAVVLMASLVSFGIGATLVSNANTTSTASTNTTTSAAAAPANVPNATQDYGNQLAHYVVDPDGAKHFTFTAEQVMWEVVKGQRVLAWTINGTVPGPMIRVTVPRPMIRVTAGDHVRITLINHFPKATAIHWHGLEVPSNQDGVPGISMSPVQPGQTYTYDFTVHDQDVGTHWYHSHYDDLEQMAGGMYGAFIVDPRPGTPQWQQEQALHIDAEYTEFIATMPGGWYVINGKSFPDTQPIVVKHGQTIRLRLIGADTMMMHPMHLHGHTYTVIAEDGHMLQPSARYQKDTLQVAPGESYDATFYAWAAPGSVYPLHCHILSHLMNPNQTGDEMGGLITLIEYAK